MLFSFHCPACKGRLEVDASLSGSQADCPQCGKPVAIPEPRVAAGTTLAGFRLERRLGKGGMGEVYLAQQLSVKRQVAVKILPSGFASNADAIQRFMHEGRLAARLDHFNIVTVFEAGEDNGHFYLAMAYIEGESLDQRLKRDKVLPETEALAIARTIADALAYAWETFQLLHRDLKPANIMVDHRKRVFLMDLGLAKSVGDESGMTLSGAIVGTPQYMSPEQALGAAELSVPTDIYALGATLYHLVTGAPPFSGDSALKVLSQHINAPLPPPRQRNPQVSEGCSRLIETMMAKAPAERYGDWRALIADVDRVLQGKVPAAHRPGAGASVVMPAGDQGPSVTAKVSTSSSAPDAMPRQQQASPPSAAATALQQVPGLEQSREAATGVTQPALAEALTQPAQAAPRATRRPTCMVTICLAVTVVVMLAVTGNIVARRVPMFAVSASGATGDHERASAAAAPRTYHASMHDRSSPAQSAAPATSPAFGQPWTVPDLGLELVWVAPGSFQMGAADVAPPVHTVRISRGYWIGKYETTQAEYEAVKEKNQGLLKGARNPVETVSWSDAAAFCTKLTAREQKAGRLPQGYEYRLPTEAEWEYAARGGTKSHATSAGSGPGFTHSGSNNVDEVAWYYVNSGDRRLDDSDGKIRESNVSSNNCRTHPVGQKKPNELGLYDLSGNVWEWCLDWYDATYYSRSSGTDPVNLQAGSYRVARGGCWDCGAGRCGVAARIDRAPSHSRYGIGFRLVAAPAISAAAP